MIAEPGLTSASLWNSDLILKDFYKSYMAVDDDMGFPNFDAGRSRNPHDNSTAAAFGSSGSTSSASSDCSEELTFDMAQYHDEDYLNPPLSLLDGQNVTVCPEAFDWGMCDNMVATSLMDEQANNDSCMDSCPSYSRSRCRSPIDPVMDNKLWSRMCMEERLHAVEALTSIVSNQMGLREQFDIIGIIEPSAKIRDTDTEFVIDLNSLNDEKLCNVRKYVRQVQKQQRAKLESESPSCSSSSSSSSPPCKMPCGASVGKGSFSHCNGSSSSATSSSLSSRPIKNEPGATSLKNCPSVGKGSSSQGKGCTNRGKSGPSLGKGGLHQGKAASSQGKEKQLKKETKERRAPPPKAFRQRQKKEQRQLMKERRSGLFEQEQVLTLSVFPVVEDDDADIDILD